MKQAPILTIPAIEPVYLTPVELVEATWVPILDEETRILRDDQGLPIYEG